MCQNSYFTFSFVMFKKLLKIKQFYCHFLYINCENDKAFICLQQFHTYTHTNTLTNTHLCKSLKRWYNIVKPKHLHLNIISYGFMFVKWVCVYVLYSLKVLQLLIHIANITPHIPMHKHTPAAHISIQVFRVYSAQFHSIFLGE